MPRNLRHRSSSVGSQHSEGEAVYTSTFQQSPSSRNISNIASTPSDDFEIGKRLLSSLLYIKDASGRSFLHTHFHLRWAKALLDRAKSLDECREQYHARVSSGSSSSSSTTSATHNNVASPATSSLLQRRFLLQPDAESGYTPFHRAIVGGNLAAMLLFLRHAMDTAGTDRLTQRPMTVLHAADTQAGNHHHAVLSGQTSGSNHSSNLLHAMATATDHEGFTPLQLMGHLQRSELARCRQALEQHFPMVDHRADKRLRPRQPSFAADDDNDDDHVDFSSENGDVLQSEASCDTGNLSSSSPVCEYACEVVTYGRPHHCALGVVHGGGGGGTSSTSSKATASGSHHQHSTAFCPQRIKTFAQDTVGREGAAVAVAAATHHTLVVTQNGHVYACGLEKGGRLGLGDDQPQQCPLPRRIMGALQRRKVVAVAAAENHSLCVTREGQVYAWGSNRFGQLGDSTVTGGNSNAGSDCGNGNSRRRNPRDNNITTTGGRSLPRRVEDLKCHPCVGVAAGERHSVALSRKGEVYVWGDNTAGQLGVPRRSGIQKVQRVEALWGQNNHPKIAIAIAASDHSTLVLTGPTPGVTSVNSIYEWGHGNHVPIRVHFEYSRSDGNGRRDSLSLHINKNKLPLAPQSSRVANPVAIACARYHNAAITTDGRVYTWGLHADSLGRCNNNKLQTLQEQQQRYNAMPELVSGMLPEKGGGFAVAIAAADQHTAVVCDNGALFTWGTTDGKDLLGHEGVRWQPSPKRVPGVHRAVNVAVAKEHTVLLIGTSFPSPPKIDCPASLELLAARKAAEHVDLFNVIPVLIMAERIESPSLIEFCTNFVRRNLDGVLNVSKRSEMNQYLEDMVADTTYRAGKRYRDDHHHPFVFDVLTAGIRSRLNFDRNCFADLQEWTHGCKELHKSRVVQSLLTLADLREYEEDGRNKKNRPRRTSSCHDEYEVLRQKTRAYAGGLDRTEMSVAPKRKENTIDQCIKKTAKMDLSTTALANDQAELLAKEIRGIRKKLNQIYHLQESSRLNALVLSSEQRAKVDRRPTLEAELSIYEAAMEEVEKRKKELNRHDTHRPISSPKGSQGHRDHSKSNASRVTFAEDNKNHTIEETPETPREAMKALHFFCDTCHVKCSDNSNLILHRNGRRHRNRVAQVEEEEKKLAAKSIHEKQQAAQINSAPIRTELPKKETNHIWGAAQPNYKLPPPPHPVVSQVTPQSRRASMQQDNSSISASPPKKIPSQALNFVAILKEQQEATKLNPSKATKRSTASPIWDSSPGSTRCVPLSLYTESHLALVSLESQRESRPSVSLADFLNPSSFGKAPTSASPSVSTGKSCPQGAPWLNLQIDKASNAKSIMQIQSEEADLRARQDKSYGKGGGSWFVERRERADSLLVIQKCAEKDLEHRLLVEEQLRIEAQIQEDLRRQQEGNGNKNPKGRRRRLIKTSKRASGDCNE